MARVSCVETQLAFPRKVSGNVYFNMNLTPQSTRCIAHNGNPGGMLANEQYIPRNSAAILIAETFLVEEDSTNKKDDLLPARRMESKCSERRSHSRHQLHAARNISPVTQHARRNFP